MITDVLKIVIVIVFIVDYSGFVDNIKMIIFKFLLGRNMPYKEYSLKPFDCSLCMSFWTVLAYLIFNHMGLLDSFLIASLSGFTAKIISPVFKVIEQITLFVYDCITDKID